MLIPERLRDISDWLNDVDEAPSYVGDDQNYDDEPLSYVDEALSYDDEPQSYDGEVLSNDDEALSGVNRDLDCIKSTITIPSLPKPDSRWFLPGKRNWPD